MKLKKILFLCLSLLIVNSSLLIATVRYVSKTGTSTPPYTSWQIAATSIQLCINVCVDGDTIYVANGVYKENLVINTAISLIGSSIDSTVIDGTGLAEVTLDFQKTGIIKSLNIIGKGSTGVAILASRYIEISFCQISHSGIGIGILQEASNIKSTIIFNVSRAYDVGCFSSECLNILSNSLIYLTNQYSIGALISFGGNYFLDNNIILFAGSNNQTTYGISIGSPKTVYINNTLISGFGSNIFTDDPIDSIKIYNSILANGNKAFLGTGDIISAINSIIKNNLVGFQSDNLLTSNYNLFWKNNKNSNGTISLGDSNLYADPMFVNDTIPTANGNYDFHLQKYSPAIDKGDPSILDVDRSRSDIGLFGGPYGESYTYRDLAPKPPANLTASLDSGLVHLKWNKNTEADLFHYRVYRDTVPDFIYDTTKIIAVISDTTFYDDPPQKYISGNYYYKITAIDSAYHQSATSEEKHINITGIPEAPPIVIEHYRLLNNYPNPFNPSTTIPYRLKAPGYVKVMVYNLLGELVRVLVNQYQSAGYYEVLFHPTASERKSTEGKIEFETGYGDIVSGIYLYRIEVIGEGNIPVFTDMKKMMLVK